MGSYLRWQQSYLVAPISVARLGVSTGDPAACTVQQPDIEMPAMTRKSADASRRPRPATVKPAPIGTAAGGTGGCFGHAHQHPTMPMYESRHGLNSPVKGRISSTRRTSNGHSHDRWNMHHLPTAIVSVACWFVGAAWQRRLDDLAVNDVQYGPSLHSKEAAALLKARSSHSDLPNELQH